MSILSDNLTHLRHQRGLTQAALAEAVGMTQPTVYRILSGASKNPEIENVRKLAEYFKVPLQAILEADLTQGAYVAIEFPPMTARAGDAPDDGGETVEVPECSVRFSAGPGREAVFDEIEDACKATYRLSWFQQQHMNPAHVKRFKVAGRSMEPLLFHGDTILVNLDENDPQAILDGRVYALRYGNEQRVKRLFRRLDGTLILRSENPEFGEEIVPPELAANGIAIIGRVRDKSGSGGL